MKARRTLGPGHRYVRKSGVARIVAPVRVPERAPDRAPDRALDRAPNRASVVVVTPAHKVDKPRALDAPQVK